MLKFLFGIHCHQPVGNFDYVFENAYKKSYKKFLDTAFDYPDFKFSIHFTGPLLEWIEKKHPEYVEKLRSLAARRQVEILISGFYEPVLAAIPEYDRVAQILYAKEYIVKKFHKKPNGLWLTERVWDPSIVKSLIKSGIKYVLVDDFHFLSAGFDKSDLYGYFLTESEGETLAIFPIDEKLRYLTPFKPIDETVEYLKQLNDQGKSGAIIFDDGEKFGIWPGTYDWVYRKRWLRNFIEKILSLEFVQTSTFSEFMEEERPVGRAYLPTSSYFEMSEWSLVPEKAAQFVKFVEHLKNEGIFEKNKIFVRGGIWTNFLVKYSEANRMHKKMTFISKEMEKSNLPMEERIDLYRAQCNDAYWHGIFGGLYLPHLRRANYTNLLKAEKKLGNEIYDEIDIDCDGWDEIYIRTKNLVLQLKPSYGGAITEFSSLNLAINFQDTLMRRFEHYHKGFKIGKKEDKGVPSIHEISKSVNSKTMRALVYDWSERLSLLDHFILGNPDIDELESVKFQEVGDFVNQIYDYDILHNSSVRLTRKGGVYIEGKREINVFKDVSLIDNGIAVDYQVKGNSAGSIFAIEFNFSMPSANSRDSKVIIDGRIEGSFKSKVRKQGKELIMDDVVFNTGIRLLSDQEAVFNVFPVYTVSQSESGIELTYQETCIFIFFNNIEDTFENKLKILILGG